MQNNTHVAFFTNEVLFFAMHCGRDFGQHEGNRAKYSQKLLKNKQFLLLSRPIRSFTKTGTHCASIYSCTVSVSQDTVSFGKSRIL